MLAVIVLIAGIVMTILITLAVYIKNSHSVTNRLFAGLAASLVGLSLTTYFSLQTSTDQETLVWMRPIMFFVVAQNSFLFLLIKVFPADKSDFLRSKKYLLAVAYSVLVAGIALTPLLFADFQDGAPVPGPGMALFLIHALIFVGGGIVYLVLRFHRARGFEKAQLQYFLIGTVLLMTLLPASNFVAPVAFKSSQLVTFSPLYLIAFAGLFAYAIIAKRMFDIRAAVARSLAYLLSLAFLGLAYGTIVFALSRLLSVYEISVNVERAAFIGFALVTAILFPSIKRFFDRITNRLFFKDSYDPQRFIDELTGQVAHNVELQPLLKAGTESIRAALKPERIAFVINLSKKSSDKIVHTADKWPVGPSDLTKLEEIMSAVQKPAVITQLSDDLPASVRRQLNRRGISVLVKLVSGSKDIGYLVLGDKKSGDVYNRQDYGVLDIISDELALGIENALHFSEIQKFNETLQQEVDDATKQLRHTNEKLKALDETKDEFISMASHQLRTPLTSVKGYVSMVLEGDAGELNEQQRKLLNQAFISSQRMVYLIADLLNVSRLHTGKFVIETSPTSLPDVVEGELSQLYETAEAKGLKLHFEKPEDFPILNLDETKIRQVIMNFADNAIYYTPAGGEITVALNATPSTVEFTVTDTGLGVPKKEQHHLFSKFYRAENAKKARPDGTGLGLFMAKKVVIAQGGAIIFRSQEGKGSTFGFTFPRKQLEASKEAHTA